MKKPFKETKFGKFLLEKIPGAINVIGDVLPDKGLLGIVKNIIDESSLPPEEKKELLRMQNEFELEWYRIEVEDRDSARTRETELAKTGESDWLMYAAGGTGLVTFILMVLAVVFMEIQNNSLFHQLMGIIEGVALTIFAYYFGSSKSSSEKNKKLFGK